MVTMYRASGWPERLVHFRDAFRDNLAVRPLSLTTRVFSGMAMLFLVAALILGLVRSFSYLAAAAIGLGFVAAALISAATRSRLARATALLALLGLMLALFGTVTTLPFLYLGMGLIAGGVAIAVLFELRTRAPRRYAARSRDGSPRG